MKPDLTWSFSPIALVISLAVLLLYVRRWRAVRLSGSPRAAAEAPVWRLCCFLASVLVVLGALCSPVDSLADQLFSAHMVQHMLLLDIAPILGILGFTKVILRPVTRAVSDLERRAGPLAHPAFAVALYAGVIWAWHVPAAYDAAVRHSDIHVLEHLSFLIAGSLYWWHLISPIRARMRLGGMGPILYMGTSKVLVGALGMAIAFAPAALYSAYAHTGPVWGLSQLDDQGVAGLIMAVEQSLVMGVAIVVLFVRMLAESEREQLRRERYEDLAAEAAPGPKAAAR
jgi:cytochrome c oxidase assembly factor CtaG